MKFNKTYPVLILIFLIAITWSCDDETTDSNDLGSLPLDTGGIHTAYPLGSTQSELGHYLYLPSGYEDTNSEYPLLVFLHGSGEKGNSQEDPSKLDLVLRNGPPKLIEKDVWNPTFPMIVASPQSQGWWNPSEIHSFMEHLVDNYQINPARIYLTGLSMGGYGTFSYIGNYGDSSFIAAAIPICGGGNRNKATSFRNIPLWAFHGDADNTVNVNNSIDMVEAINAIDSGLVYQAKLTIYPGVGHNSWSKTYDDSGMGTENSEYDAFEMSIYDWFFQYKK
ncbi:MAG: dienelactone hydrolase family protein [Reichenbachiella sp.]